ncbi:hypothetical protein [Gymnodinialimonas ulvae]|uniref:hypothetical protein n=1 Tax=Gymnodinialimonas ulvae TaxID=3126504 RepID=UPI0030A3A676
MKFIAGFFAIALIGAVVVWFLRAPSELEVRVSHGDLEAAISAALAEDPHVGRLPRARFSHLSLADEVGVILVGNGRWFNFGAGGFPYPDIELRVEIPAEPDAWEVRDGGLAVARVEIIEAERLAYDGGGGRPESEANRAGWERLIVRLFDRIESVGDLPLGFADWQIVEVEAEANGLRFVLRR